MWKSEKLYADYEQRFSIEKVLYSDKSPYQKIEIVNTTSHGKVLFLDNIVQLTEKDECIYHEMLSHISLLSHPKPKHVLVLGGGDGGIVREVLKHSVENVTLVEIDEKVINASKRYLKKVSAGAFTDKRLQVIVGDAAQFVKSTDKKFDVIITDRGDEVGPGHPLFTQSFYSNCANVLTKNGIFTSITGVSNMQPTVVTQTQKAFKKIFTYSGIFLINVPMYIGGPLAIAWGSQTTDITKISTKTLHNRDNNLPTKYYNLAIHLASFAIPKNLI